MAYRKRREFDQLTAGLQKCKGNYTSCINVKVDVSVPAAGSQEETTNRTLRCINKKNRKPNPGLHNFTLSTSVSLSFPVCFSR